MSVRTSAWACLAGALSLSACDGDDAVIDVVSGRVSVAVAVVVDSTALPLNELDLRVGEDAQLVVEVTNAVGLPVDPGAVTWASDNPGVAGVDLGGKVTGLNAGGTSVRVFPGATSVSGALPVRVASSPPPAGASRLGQNEPAGMRILYHATGEGGVNQLAQGFDVIPDRDMWSQRNDVIVDTSEPGEDGRVFRHRHPGNGRSSSANFAGNANVRSWRDVNASLPNDVDTLYLYMSINNNNQASIHGRKLFFIGAEDGAQSDGRARKNEYYMTWERGLNADFTAQSIGGDWSYASGANEWNDNRPFEGKDARWVQLEVLMIGSSEGGNDGQIRVWVDGDLMLDARDVRFSDANPAGCTNNQCGFGNWQWYLNTDAATTGQHYFYTGEVYLSGKGN